MYLYPPPRVFMQYNVLDTHTHRTCSTHTEAGAAFCRAADVQMQLEVKHEAGTNLVEAGQVLKRVDPQGKCMHSCM